MADQRQVLQDVRRGMIPAHIYNDAEIFQLEKERLFSRAWLFVAHESEIPQDGDYVVRRVLDDSFIIARDSNGEIRAMFNMCLHRGMQVCRAEMGNASHFRCPYHGWSYRNDGRIVGLPFHQDAYGGEAGSRRKGQTLLPAPSSGQLQRADLHQHGPGRRAARGVPRRLRVLPRLLHQAESAAASSCAGRSGGGSRRTGRSARRTSPATCTTRRRPTRPSWRSACSASPRRRSARTAPRTGRDSGGGTTYKLPPGTFEERMRYVGYPDDMIERMKGVWTTEQRNWSARTGS